MATPPVVRCATGLHGEPIPAPLLDWANGQVVTVGASSLTSTDYKTAGAAGQGNNWDTIWEVCSTANCWITVGASPTAAAHTAGSHYLPAGQTRYVYIPQGQKLAVIEDSTGGFLSLIPALLDV